MIVVMQMNQTNPFPVALHPSAQSGERGVLADDLANLINGGQVVALSGHRAFVRGASSVPILCAEVVPIDTEDGPGAGRCLWPIANFEAGRPSACEGHREELEAWASMPESERLAWERRTDEDGGW